MDLALGRASTTSVDVAVDGSGAAPVNQMAKSGCEAGGPNVIPAPSTDAIYTSMMLNLRREPKVLRIPPVTDGRFWDMEFLDPYTNVFAYVGTRCSGATPPPFAEALEACAATTDQAGGDFAIVGPRWKGTLPAGLIRVRAPYDRIWVGGRTLVGGDASQADIDAATAVQETYRLRPLSTYSADWSPAPPRRPSLVLKTQPDPVATKRGLRWFAYLNRQMAITPPPGRDRPLLRRLRGVGVGAGLTPRLVRLPGPVKQGLHEGIRIANVRITAELATGTRNAVVRTNAWSVPPPDTGNFGTDYLTRTVLDAYGIGAFTPPSGTPPIQAGGFWSLTVYDSQMFLVARPWAIGNRSGLVTEPDGSVKVRLQATALSSGSWLLTLAPDPSANPPVTDAFNLTMRIYAPQQSVCAGTWTYPTERRVK